MMINAFKTVSFPHFTTVHSTPSLFDSLRICDLQRKRLFIYFHCFHQKFILVIFFVRRLVSAVFNPLDLFGNGWFVHIYLFQSIMSCTFLLLNIEIPKIYNLPPNFLDGLRQFYLSRSSISIVQGIYPCFTFHISQCKIIK